MVFTEETLTQLLGRYASGLKNTYDAPVSNTNRTVRKTYLRGIQEDALRTFQALMKMDASCMKHIFEFIKKGLVDDNPSQVISTTRLSLSEQEISLSGSIK